MAAADTGYSASTSTTGFGFFGSILSGIGNLFGPPTLPALPTRPNPQSQVLVAQAAGRIVDIGSPSGYSLADLWYDPISSVPGSVQSIQGYEPIQSRDPYTGKLTTTQRAVYGPKMYLVKSNLQEQNPLGAKVSDVQTLFRSPEAASIQAIGGCGPQDEKTSATIQERINRLTTNQFLSPFRARRWGGNSYQALSEAMDDIFAPNGSAGDFSPETLPAFIQSRGRSRQPR